MDFKSPKISKELYSVIFYCHPTFVNFLNVQGYFNLYSVGNQLVRRVEYCHYLAELLTFHRKQNYADKLNKLKELVKINVVFIK